MIVTWKINWRRKTRNREIIVEANSNPGEVRVIWIRMLTKYVEAYGLRYVLEGDRQDLSVVWSLSTGG